MKLFLLVGIISVITTCFSCNNAEEKPLPALGNTVVTTPVMESYASDLYEKGVPEKAEFIFIRKGRLGNWVFYDGMDITKDTLPCIAYKGALIYQGDILLSEKKIISGKEDTLIERYNKSLSEKGRFKQENFSQVYAVSEKDLNRRWTNGQVYYSINTNLSDQRANIESAINTWGKLLKGVVTFIEITPGQHVKNYAEFMPSDGYASNVGMTGDRQEVEVKPEANIGNIMHEIGHLLGLWHEHSHPDRDKFIIIIDSNVKDKAKQDFERKDLGEVDASAYDFGSIMHYDSLAFSNDNKPTIILRPPYKGQVFGQRNNPSKGDVDQILKLYSK